MSVRILEGDALQVLRTLADCSVQCCVTSPPYFGLRDYGTALWDGGSDDCDHSPEKRGGRFATPVSGKQASNAGSGSASSRDCPCGATRVDRQLGLEKTPQLYVDAMVGVFSEVKRVLRDDGTLWLNIGDSYAGSGKGGNPEEGKQATNRGSQSIGVLYGKTGETARQAAVTNVTRKTFEGIKAKDLIGIPWMLAFALRADGWYLRSDIIWAKPNPMPESVTDRPTKSHEYLFLLTKSASYLYDADAIAEPSVSTDDARFGGPRIAYDRKTGPTATPDYRGQRSAVTIRERRNRRSVWTVNTSPYSEAHFATFPPKLIEPCILAGSAKGQTVLDPFGGAGTTGLVADRLGRDAILIELNPKYAEMARKRITDDSPLFGDVA